MDALRAGGGKAHGSALPGESPAAPRSITIWSRATFPPRMSTLLPIASPSRCSYALPSGPAARLPSMRAGRPPPRARPAPRSSSGTPALPRLHGTRCRVVRISTSAVVEREKPARSRALNASIDRRATSAGAAAPSPVPRCHSGGSSHASEPASVCSAAPHAQRDRLADGLEVETADLVFGELGEPDGSVWPVGDPDRLRGRRDRVLEDVALGRHLCDPVGCSLRRTRASSSWRARAT